jgi:hypothetical protein
LLIYLTPNLPGKWVGGFGGGALTGDPLPQIFRDNRLRPVGQKDPRPSRQGGVSI